MSQLNVDNIQNRTGSSGGPNFPSGISVAVGQTAYIHGNLQVDGTETIINTETLNVADKTVGIGSTSNASNTTADGAGIEIFASSSQTGNNKTLIWNNTENSWQFGPNDVGLKVGTGVTINSSGGGLDVASGLVSLGDNTNADSQLTITNSQGDCIRLRSKSDSNAFKYGIIKQEPYNNNSVGLQIIGGKSDSGYSEIAIGGGIDGGYAATQIDFYTGATTTTTTGTRRLRIGSAGQLGIGGANYGTSGQVLTSGGGSAAPSWSAIPAGGNVITAVANGSIANNKCVQIRTADGKVEEIKETAVAADASTTNEEWYTDSGDSASWSTTVIDPDAACCIVYSQDNNSDIAFTNIPISSAGVLGARSQTMTAVDNSTYGAMSADRRVWTATYDTTNNKHIVVWNSQQDGKLYYKVGTMSGSTLSFGSIQTAYNQSAFKPQVLFDEGTGRIVLAFGRTANDNAMVQIGSYNSGTGVVDWGTAQSIQAEAHTGPLAMSKASSTTGQYAIFRRQTNNNNCTGSLITVSSSSNTCTIQTQNQIVSYASQNYEVAYDANANNMCIVWQKGSDNRMYIRRVKVNSGSTGLETDGSEEMVVVQNIGQDLQIAYSPSALRCYTWWRDPSYGNATRWRAVTNTTGTVTLGGEHSPSPNPDTYSNELGFPAVHAASGNIVFGINNQPVGGRGQLWSIKTTALQSNLTQGRHFLGFADQAYTDGQTATIKTYGNNVDTLSGLTIGTKYYVSPNGDIATSGTGGNQHALAGLAIGTNKLLIREPNDKND